MKTKTVKLTPALVRRIVAEESKRLSERLGPWDAKGLAGQDLDAGMRPENFEETHKELFSQALEPVVDEFINSIKELGLVPPGTEDDLNDLSAQMQDELFAVIMKYADRAVDLYV